MRRLNEKLGEKSFIECWVNEVAAANEFSLLGLKWTNFLFAGNVSIWLIAMFLRRKRAAQSEPHIRKKHIIY